MYQQMHKIVCAVARVNANGAVLLGSAFLLAEGFFVTTKHVTGADDSGLQIVLPKVTSLHDFQDTSDNDVKLLAVSIHAIDPFTDLCLLKPKQQHKSTVKVGKADAVSVGDPVAIFGFPHADHGRLVLTQQISTVGAKVLIASGERSFKHLVL